MANEDIHTEPTTDEPSAADAAAPAEQPSGPAIIGVGASAGGLEAFTELLKALPQQPGVAMVFAQHLSPDQESSLAELLSQATSMQVEQAVDDTALGVDHLYVIPPQSHIEVREGRIRLVDRRGDHAHPAAVDTLFRSLAEGVGVRAVGVLLSGTGSDGVAGLEAIRATGGLALVQDPATAKYDGMPRAAVARAAVDQILSPEQLAEAIARFGRDWATGAGASPPPVTKPGDPPGAEATTPAATSATAIGSETDAAAEPHLHAIFRMVRERTGSDFTGYKRATIHRRLRRRMAIVGVESLAQYRQHLADNPAEAYELYKDFLIHVTRFFREPESFEGLARTALPRILEQHEHREPLRIWVAGCSTGEEPYSVAITALEAIEAHGVNVLLQLFGTDLSEDAVSKVRQGVYPENIAADVSQQRLNRFFTRIDGYYQINKQVRDQCIFARQDLTRDPPFSGMDLVVCRNLLIYLNQDVQQRILHMLHYALKPHGLLMLGASESVGSEGDLYTVMDKQARIYAKRQLNKRRQLTTGLAREIGDRRREGAAPREPTDPARQRRQRPVQQVAEAVLLERYSPPGVLVDKDYTIVQVRGQTGDFLEPAEGEASLNLLKMAREGLLHALRTGLHEAGQSDKEVRREDLHIKADGEVKALNLALLPLHSDDQRHFLVLFEQPPEAASPEPHRPTPAPDTEEESERVKELEQQLEDTRSYLNSIIRDLEMTNEDYQSAHEEILSSNEELQSTNEELDTAKEELQSSNEELNTLNEELNTRNDELNKANSDLLNLLNNVHIPVVIVDDQQRIRRFTPHATDLFNLLESDLGRPISQIKPDFDAGDLSQMIHQVINEIAPTSRDVQDSQGRWHSLYIRPYKDVDKRINGAVLSLFDVDAARRFEAQLREQRDYAQAIVETVRHPLLVLDEHLRINTVNDAFCTTFHVARQTAEGEMLYDLAGQQWDIPELRRLLSEVQQQNTRFDDYAMTQEFPAIGRQRLMLSARRMDFEIAGEPLILLAMELTGET